MEIIIDKLIEVLWIEIFILKFTTYKKKSNNGFEIIQNEFHLQKTNI